MFEGKGKRQGSGAGWTKGEQSRQRQPLLDGWSLQLQQVRARSGRVCGLWLAVVCRRGAIDAAVGMPWDATVSPAAGPSRSSSAVLHDWA